MSSRVLALGLAAVLVLPGCVSLEMGRMKREIERDVEAAGTAEVGRGFAVALGRGTIGSSRFLTRLFAPSATEPYRALSRHVRQVKVARYDVTGSFDGRDVGRPSALDRYEADGWVSLVTVRDPEQAVWVLYREDARRLALTDLLAIALTDEDLVLTRLRGDLSSLVLDAAAMGAEGDLFGGAFDETGVFGPRDDEEADREDSTVDAAP
ncbi:DUF4252 domain-containing protein [Rubrivirga marina]|uniref:DUF4252 domain-containing protein n=1 Tax=Rubrivirga marina TaxID=1196024 RepID=UPI001179D653|nr:DUF4252 domain-containing protein [Rubrivirga marina]